MHFLNLSQYFNEMKKNEEESFLSSVKCRIRTVYYGLVHGWVLLGRKKYFSGEYKVVIFISILKIRRAVSSSTFGGKLAKYAANIIKERRWWLRKWTERILY